MALVWLLRAAYNRHKNVAKKDKPNQVAANPKSLVVGARRLANGARSHLKDQAE
jgi:hypothetical protein